MEKKISNWTYFIENGGILCSTELTAKIILGGSAVTPSPPPLRAQLVPSWTEQIVHRQSNYLVLLLFAAIVKYKMEQIVRIIAQKGLNERKQKLI